MAVWQQRGVAALKRPLIWFSGLAGVAVAVAAGATLPGAAPQASAPLTGVSAAPPAQAASPRAASPWDEPLRLLAEAARSFQGVKDYSCTLIKREQIRGKLEPENVIAMKVRNEPFSVSLKWSEPKAIAGQEACYVAGKNKGMMRVKSKGVLGAVGFVNMDPNDPRVRENSRHAITEAGVGNLIDQFARAWDVERRANKTQVRVADYEFNQRACTRVETIHTEPGDGPFAYYRSVVYFDREHHLPVRVENYDWPRKGGNPDGELLEVVSYVDLKLNVKLTDDVFNK